MRGERRQTTANDDARLSADRELQRKPYVCARSGTAADSLADQAGYVRSGSGIVFGISMASTMQPSTPSVSKYA
jgi:hypothetical protein